MRNFINIITESTSDFVSPKSITAESVWDDLSPMAKTRLMDQLPYHPSHDVRKTHAIEYIKSHMPITEGEDSEEAALAMDERIRANIIHSLRLKGVDRIDAESQAEDRIEELRAKRKKTVNEGDEECGHLMNLGHRMNDQTTYDIIGKRIRGSFRSALRDFGFSKAEIDRVIHDVDCDREVMIVGHGGHKNWLRPM